jgi:hypothetical protein
LSPVAVSMSDPQNSRFDAVEAYVAQPPNPASKIPPFVHVEDGPAVVGDMHAPGVDPLPEPEPVPVPLPAPLPLFALQHEPHSEQTAVALSMVVASTSVKQDI